MARKRYAILIVFAVFAILRTSYAGEGMPRAVVDSLPQRLAGSDSSALLSRHDPLYDSIRARYTRTGFQRLLYNSLFVRRQGNLDSLLITGALDESQLYEPYEGMTISRIDIVSEGLMSSDSTWVERAASRLHTTTRERAIRRDMLIRQGQPLDPELMTKNSHNIRSRSYIADVETLVEPDPENPGQVLVTIITKDRWSISLDGDFYGGGRTMLKAYDANVLGYGSKLGVAANFDLSESFYAGTQVELNTPNLFGSYFDLYAVAGRDFDNSNYGAEIKKEFLLPTDYAAGISYFDSDLLTYQLYADSSRQIHSRTGDVWAGASFYSPNMKSSAYATSRYTFASYPDRPPVAARLNPAYHDTRLTLAAAGLYREKFFSANMIYGYGYREYLAAGYRAEIVGGYSAGEFVDQWYVGASYRMGGFGRLGYLMGGVGVGCYLPTEDRNPGRGALAVESQYFTNLMKLGLRWYVRQFVSLSILQGWNRYWGSNEVVTFQGDHSLRAMDKYTAGVNRTHLSAETVLFTPYQPWGFRITLFGYADMGLVGNNPNQFENPFYSTIGAGIRIKNERMVFNALEIRLGFAVGHGGLVNSRYMNIGSQNRVPQIRFTPTAPHTIDYR